MPILIARSIGREHMLFCDQWLLLPISPGINGGLYCPYEGFDLLISPCRCIDRHNLIDRAQVPLIDILVAYQVIPIDKAILPKMVLPQSQTRLAIARWGNRGLQRPE